MWDRRAPRPWIIAHRGASEEEPENTLRAFRRAIELGADMVELDLHQSRDGHLVVIHDGRVDATTDGHGEVAALTLAELRRLDAGRGERIPTFEEVLELAPDGCGLYVELKGAGTAGPAVEAIRRHGLAAAVIVGSFQRALVAEAQARAAEIPTSLLVRPGEADPVGAAVAAGAAYVHLCWERRSENPADDVTPALLRECRAAGRGVILWHEERPAVIARLRGLPVDGVCGNRPELLRELKAAAAPGPHARRLPAP
jgi:glycerophosphoryl diester phosphodiesterase